MQLIWVTGRPTWILADTNAAATTTTVQALLMPQQPWFPRVTIPPAALPPLEQVRQYVKLAIVVYQELNMPAQKVPTNLAQARHHVLPRQPATMYQPQEPLRKQLVAAMSTTVLEQATLVEPLFPRATTPPAALPPPEQDKPSAKQDTIASLVLDMVPVRDTMYQPLEPPREQHAVVATTTVLTQ